MKIPLLVALFFSIIIGLQVKLRLTKKREQGEAESKEAYLKREREASHTRKKTLEDLDYIILDLSLLQPITLLKCEPATLALYEEVKSLAEYPMISLRGLDNTDLKFKYGVGNLTTLITYETSYQNCLHRLYDLGEALEKEGFLSEACLPLAQAIKMNSDMSKHYRLYASLLHELRRFGDLDALTRLVETRDFFRKESTLQHLKNLRYSN